MRSFGGDLQLCAVGVDDADGLDLCRCLGSGGRSSCGDVSADAFDCIECLLEGLFCGGVDGGHLALDIEAIGREVVGYVEELARDDVADAEDADEGHDAGQCDGKDAREAASFEAADGGR